MSSNVRMYITPGRPLFNPNIVFPFHPLNQQFTSLLSLAFLLTLMENSTFIDVKPELIILLDTSDKNYIPEPLLSCNVPHTISYINTSTISEEIANKYGNHAQEGIRYIFARSSCYGIIPKQWNRIFDLLLLDEKVIMPLVSEEGSVVGLGLNSFVQDIDFSFLSLSLPFNDFLPKICKADGHLVTKQFGHSLDSVEDFRNLYKFLSSKESIPYCSKEMHARFTEVFIEYKEIL